ncbi:hypothetical protein ACHQM5_018059 [Ranunculus cassubicifolius]
MNTPAATTNIPATAPPPPPPSSSETLGFDGISKHFNMPIADAATALGVCSSVLKKICRDNGLVRWPYRKFLAGKSIEDIQKDAAREKRRAEYEQARISRQKDVAAALAASTVSQQQQGAEAIYSIPTRKIPSYVDEFEQGFPSKGLSEVNMRWWGAGEESNELADNEEESNDLAENEEGLGDMETDTNDNRSQWAGLLASVRGRAAAEGRENLKLGVYRNKCGFKVSGRDKLLLLQVFKSSLPHKWINGSD